MVQTESTLTCPRCGHRSTEHRCLPVLLRVQGLRRDAQAVAGRLLRILFLRHGAVPARAGGPAPGV